MWRNDHTEKKNDAVVIANGCSTGNRIIAIAKMIDATHKTSVNV